MSAYLKDNPNQKKSLSSLFFFFFFFSNAGNNYWPVYTTTLSMITTKGILVVLSPPLWNLQKNQALLQNINCPVGKAKNILNVLPAEGIRTPSTWKKKKKKSFLSVTRNCIWCWNSCIYTNTTLWMYHMDADKTHWEKVRLNCTRMLWVILKKSWKQHPTRQQLYSHLPPISKTLLMKWTRHAGHCRKKQGWTH